MTETILRLATLLLAAGFGLAIMAVISWVSYRGGDER